MKTDVIVCTEVVELAKSRVRIVVADQHPVVLHGIGAILESDTRLQVVGRFLTMPSLVEAIVRQEPDVAIVGWPLASQAIESTTAMLRQSGNLTTLVFLTAADNYREKAMLIRLGASAVTNRSASANELLRVIWSACGLQPTILRPASDIGSTSQDFDQPSAHPECGFFKKKPGTLTWRLFVNIIRARKTL